MHARRYFVCVSVALLFIAGCATAPEDESRRQAKILSISASTSGVNRSMNSTAFMFS
jgi:outer membrane lipoprotein-sorting protein